MSDDSEKHTDIVSVPYNVNSIDKASQPIKKKPRGRPPKKAIDQHKKKNAVGRPKGDAAIMNDYKARMLASPKSRRVLESIFDAALDDEHKNQASAWKLIVDRIMPVSMFEKEVNGGGSSRPSVNITISGVSSTEISSSNSDVIDGELDNENN